MRLGLGFILALGTSAAFAQTYVNPHVRRDGTFVEGHFRTAPDRNPYNNYSSQGNFNPYSGTPGRRDPFDVQQQYRQPRDQRQFDPVYPTYRR
jgi:hypothetical protein